MSALTVLLEDVVSLVGFFVGAEAAVPVFAVLTVLVFVFVLMVISQRFHGIDLPEDSSFLDEPIYIPKPASPKV